MPSVEMPSVEMPSLEMPSVEMPSLERAVCSAILGRFGIGHVDRSSHSSSRVELSGAPPPPTPTAALCAWPFAVWPFAVWPFA
eukprot:4686386-Prymnesium_polylepis.1